MPKLDKFNEITLWARLHPTPFHEHGLDWEAFQLSFRELGAAQLPNSEIKACPSEFKANTVLKQEKPQNNKKVALQVFAIAAYRGAKKESTRFHSRKADKQVTLENGNHSVDNKRETQNFYNPLEERQPNSELSIHASWVVKKRWLERGKESERDYVNHNS